MTSNVFVVGDFNRSAYVGESPNALEACFSSWICVGSSPNGVQMSSWGPYSSRNAHARRISVQIENKHRDWDLRWKLASWAPHGSMEPLQASSNMSIAIEIGVASSPE